MSNLASGFMCPGCGSLGQHFYNGEQRYEVTAYGDTQRSFLVERKLVCSRCETNWVDVETQTYPLQGEAV